MDIKNIKKIDDIEKTAEAVAEITGVSVEEMKEKGGQYYLQLARRILILYTMEWRLETAVNESKKLGEFLNRCFSMVQRDRKLAKEEKENSKLFYFLYKQLDQKMAGFSYNTYSDLINAINTSAHTKQEKTKVYDYFSFPAVLRDVKRKNNDYIIKNENEKKEIDLLISNIYEMMNYVKRLSN